MRPALPSCAARRFARSLSDVDLRSAAVTGDGSNVRWRPSCRYVAPPPAWPSAFPGVSSGGSSSSSCGSSSRSSRSSRRLPAWSVAVRHFSDVPLRPKTAEETESAARTAAADAPSEEFLNEQVLSQGGHLGSGPNEAQLKMMFLASALPFVGFGFLDNFLMIVCGELIDNSLCVVFNFSTMAAAAIGNTISDAAGIFSGGVVENWARQAGVEEPPMTSEQRIHPETKYYQYTGQLVGILTGCILGSCPLLWMDPNEGARQRRVKEREEVFESVIVKVQEILGAEAVSLMMVDKDKQELVSTHQSSNLPNAWRWRMVDGFMGHVATTGQFVNMADIQDEPLYNPNLHDNLLGTGIKIQSMLCMPIYCCNEVKGLLMVVNKLGSNVAFSQKDEDIMSAICSHISVAMADDKHTFKEVIDLCEKSMKTTGSAQYSTSAASQRMATLFVPALEGIRNVLGAEATTLMLLDQEAQDLYTEVIDGPLPHHRTPIGVGVAGQAVKAGHLMNVEITRTGEAKPGWFNAQRHKNYQGSAMEVRSELVVPLFDTSQKCMGVIKCINKAGAAAFGTEDVKYVSEVAHHIGMMLEGPDAGLRRVLRISRERMQNKSVMEATDLGKGAVICNLVKAKQLPTRASADSQGRTFIDPYITFSIVRGSPINEEIGAQQRQLRSRNKDRKAAIRRYGKSSTILEDANPEWNETIAVAMPMKFRQIPIEELWVHVQLWDYDSLKPDDLVAQTAFPLTQFEQMAELPEAMPQRLLPIPGQESVYNLEESLLWVSFTRRAPHLAL
mmetsp:Transcript_22237/g.39550  ORF Transcript_22237/g.39550 Transcript_22237/m.39550 type:complete len:786 (+) Transcript_22237:109-2466(+)